MKLVPIAGLIFAGVVGTGYAGLKQSNQSLPPLTPITGIYARAWTVPQTAEPFSQSCQMNLPGPPASEPAGNQLVVNTGHTAELYYTFRDNTSGHQKEFDGGFRYVPPVTGYPEGYWYPFERLVMGGTVHEVSYESSYKFTPDADFTDLSVDASFTTDGGLDDVFTFSFFTPFAGQWTHLPTNWASYLSGQSVTINEIIHTGIIREPTPNTTGSEYIKQSTHHSMVTSNGGWSTLTSFIDKSYGCLAFNPTTLTTTIWVLGAPCNGKTTTDGGSTSAQ